MQRIATASLIGLTLLAFPATAASHRIAGRPACPARHAKTLLADPQAAVYSEVEHYGFFEIRACARGHRSYGLRVETQEGNRCKPGCIVFPNSFALAGTMVAYGENTEPGDKYEACPCGKWFVVVRNLLTGRVLVTNSTGDANLAQGTSSPPKAGNYVGVGPALDVIVKSDGAVAWLVYNEISRQPGQYEVPVADRLGSRVVAVDPNLDPASLAIAGSTLYWTANGTAASARLE